MPKPTPRKRTAAQLARDAEATTRMLRAKLEATQIKAAMSYHQAADRGRRNRDWQPKQSSADLAIIPELSTIIARSRLAVANTWVGAAARRAHVRNVIGKGMMVVPAARDANGADLPDLNAATSALFMRWASDRTAADVERRRTWWQIQRMVASEEFVAGGCFVIWSYVPHPTRVGLTLQVAECEQLDASIQSYGDNEVRGGIELDGDGAPVAYHFYRRSPNDYLGRSTFDSVRVPAGRVLHYYDAERVQQTHGLPRMAPVLQDLRDFDRFRSATLMRAMMEACVGLIINKSSPTGQGFGMTLPTPAGDTGLNAGGTARTAEFKPGMLFEGGIGESVTSMTPTTPGNGFQPFTELQLRGVGAGTGMSMGALTRHSDGNYSAARQDMLEDEREIGPVQDLFIDLIALPVYELWHAIAVAEGRLDVPSDYYENVDRYNDAECIPPVRPWIDPEKEVNAYEKAINLRITSRSDIVAQQGGRLANVLKQIKAERDMGAKEQIKFPEDIDALEKIAAARASVSSPPPPTQPPASPATLSAANAPHYRRSPLPQLACATCSHACGMACKLYDFTFSPEFLCDAWAARPLDESDHGRATYFSPRQEGVPSVDIASSRDAR